MAESQFIVKFTHWLATIFPVELESLFHAKYRGILSKAYFQSYSIEKKPEKMCVKYDLVLWTFMGFIVWTRVWDLTLNIHSHLTPTWNSRGVSLPRKPYLKKVVIKYLHYILGIFLLINQWAWSSIFFYYLEGVFDRRNVFVFVFVEPPTKEIIPTCFSKFLTPTWN